MKSLAINGALRAAQTKQELKKLRAEGKVPCVLYGGAEQIHFSTPVLSLKNLVYTPNVYTVDLTIDGTTKKAIMKDIQFEPVTDKIMHIDFMELHEDKPIKMDVPVKLNGSAAGVRQGGQLVSKMRKLKIAALPKDLPDSIEIDIEPLNIGNSVRVRDLKMDGVSFLDMPANMIVGVRVTRAVVEETPAAEAAAPAAEAKPAEGEAKPAEAKEEKKK